MGKRLEGIILTAIDNGYINFDKKRIANIHQIDKNVVVLISDERENHLII